MHQILITHKHNSSKLSHTTRFHAKIPSNSKSNKINSKRKNHRNSLTASQKIAGNERRPNCPFLWEWSHELKDLLRRRRDHRIWRRLRGIVRCLRTIDEPPFGICSCVNNAGPELWPCLDNSSNILPVRRWRRPYPGHRRFFAIVFVVRSDQTECKFGVDPPRYCRARYQWRNPDIGRSCEDSLHFDGRIVKCGRWNVWNR